MSGNYNEIPDFWNRHPCNARRGDPNQSDQDYFRQIRTNKAKVEPHIIPFMEPMRWRGKTVLDVGCGLGTQAVWFAQAGAFVTATDSSDISLEMAERHALAAGVGANVHTNLRDYEYDPLPRVAYDLIWAWGSLHHMRAPDRVLRGLRAHACGINTVLKLMLYHEHSVKVWRLKMKHGVRWREFTEANPGVPTSNAYSVAEALSMVMLAGWRVDNIQASHVFPWRVGPYKQGRYVKAFPWSICPDSVFQKIEQKWGFHLLINARPQL